ncbi:MAG: MFS transporter [Rhodospirillales bacterium]|nr:MFS transporter [Rhodospirillales bacterium]
MKRQYLAVIAGVILMITLGTIHAFSLFLVPWEAAFQVPRADVSFLYSSALVCLTLSVLLGHRLFGMARPAILVLVSAIFAALGILVAGYASSLPVAWVGYSLVFGAANGFGYGFSLQLAARAMPDRKGFAMAVISASYGSGSILFPYLAEGALNTGGVAAAMELLAGIIICAGIISALLLHCSCVRYEQEATTSQDHPSLVASPKVLQLKLWLAFGSGVAAGLMAIGHATGIVETNGGSAAQVLNAPVVVAIGNMIGGFSVGFLLDRYHPRSIVMILAIISASVLIVLSEASSSLIVLVGLTAVGACYGAVISAYPVVVAVYFGVVQAPAVYGRIFTAWGLSGLIAPWIAGVLYDQTGGYALALQIAGIFAVLSVAVAWLLPRADRSDATEVV